MQLVAYGSQDIYLTGNPQITFFKVVYRRHTNFSMESIEQTWTGNNLSGKATSVISRNGDLIYKMYLEQTFTVQTNCHALSNAINGNEICNCKEDTTKTDYLKNGGVVIYNPAHTGIDYVEIEMNGECIDKHTGNWMEVYSQLTEPNDAAVLGMAGPNTGTKYQNMARAGGVVVTSLGGWVDKVGSGQAKAVIDSLDQKGAKAYNALDPYNKEYCIKGEKDKYKVIRTKLDAYVPLRFWFCRNPGLALPLISLQYSEVRINISMKKEAISNKALEIGNNIIYETNKLYVDYIFLDTDERRRFAQVSHEYLIEQVQHKKFKKRGNVLDLNFNHPVKELIWTGGQHERTGLFGILPGGSTDYESHDYYRCPGRPGYDTTYQLKLNGTERFSERKLEYFTKQQIYDYHTGTPVGTGDSYVLDKYNQYRYVFGEAKGTNTLTDDDGIDIAGDDDQNCLYSNPIEINDEICNNKNIINRTDKWLNNKSAVWAITQQTGPGQGSNDAIAVYSFALKPEEHQPSGTCNFSRLDSVELVIENCDTNDLYCYCNEYDVYAVNYNILRIMSGMGGLAYTN